MYNAAREPGVNSWLRVSQGVSMLRLRLFCILFATMAATAIVGWSQAVNATLLGTITDSSGAVVPNAKITITETQTTVNRIAQTNESGNYIVPNLPPGIYAVSVEATGFKKETRRRHYLLVDTNTRIDIQLQPGSTHESMEVTGAPPLLQTDSAIDHPSKIDRHEAGVKRSADQRQPQLSEPAESGAGSGAGPATSIRNSSMRKARCKPK